MYYLVGAIYGIKVLPVHPIPSSPSPQAQRPWHKLLQDNRVLSGGCSQRCTIGGVLHVWNPWLAQGLFANAPVIMSLLSIFSGYLLTMSIKPGAQWRLPPQLRSTHPLDSIEGYLAAPTIDEDEIKAMGRVMMYWYCKEESCPSLSRYGTDHCSAPGQLLPLLILIVPHHATPFSFIHWCQTCIFRRPLWSQLHATQYYPSLYGSNCHASCRPGCIANLRLGHASHRSGCYLSHSFCRKTSALQGYKLRNYLI